MAAHDYRLTLVHRKLEAALDEERRRKLPDPFRVQRLKKLKLAVKDRLLRLTRSPKAI